MNNRTAVFIALIIGIFCSCHTAHIVQTTPLPIDNAVGMAHDSVTILFLKAKKRFFDYNTFSCKAKISYSDQQNGVVNLNATIRMKKDSVIWISVSPGIGIEVARILITADSIRIIDRINHKYISRGVAYLGQFISYPVDLREMQNIITGTPIGYSDASLTASKGDSSVMFVSADSDWNSNIVVNSKDFLIHQFLMQNKRKNKKLEVEFYNYNYDNASPFSLDRYMQINNPDPITISVDYSHIKINDAIRFPFNYKHE